MKIESFKGALLSTLMVVSMIALAIPLLSPSPVHAALTPHDYITINGNAGFTKPDPVNGGGSGTENDPYIIENWDIGAGPWGISIGNTTAYFIIRNCYVHDIWGTGISLNNVKNGKIDNVESISNDGGIYLYSSTNNIILNSVVENDSPVGPSGGIYLSASSNNIIENCTARNNQYGIYLWYSDNNLISGNAVGNSYVGINLDNSDNNLVENNTCDNNGTGIFLSSSNNNAITNCIVENNGSQEYYAGGIVLRESSNNIIENCIVKNTNWIDGIGLYDDSDNNIIENCTVSNSDGAGIFLSTFFYYSSDNNIIENCTLENNGYGVYIDHSDNNRIYHNNIVNNAVQAYDTGSNFWDNGYPSGGNYWSDYRGADRYRGENQDIPGGDWIGDEPYYITGGTILDRYPRTLLPPKSTSSVLISPDYQEGLPGGWLNYIVEVGNAGSLPDNYTLTVNDNRGWILALSENRLENVQPNEVRSVRLGVKIPVGALICIDSDNILVKATSERFGNENNYWCIGHAGNRVKPIEDSTTVYLENLIREGRDTTILVGRYNAPGRGWLKFDLRAIPSIENIARANLWLHCYSISGIGAAVRCHRVDNDDWSEATINWSNKPSMGSVLDTRSVYEGGRWYSWDVTDFVREQFALDNKASLCLVDLGENVTPDHATYFDSKEFGLENQWPYLEIENVAPENEVRVYVNPTFQGDRAGRVDNYVITVKNKGTSSKTYDLTIENTENWTRTLDSSSLWVSAGSENSTILHVTIPSVAAVCTVNKITITTKYAPNPSENDVTRCYAHRGEVDFKLDNKEARPNIKLGGLYTLKADFKLFVTDNSGGLRMYFYRYDNVQENASLPPATVWSVTPYNLDNEVIGPIYVQHVGGLYGVKKAKLFLVDNAGNPISKVKGWVTIRVDLWTRLGGISTSWTYATPDERNALWKEIGDLSTQWAFAPTTRDLVWIN